MKKWARPETRFSGFVAFPSLITRVYKMPYGVSLIVKPLQPAPEGASLSTTPSYGLSLRGGSL